jgi:hypothetical protein
MVGWANRTRKYGSNYLIRKRSFWFFALSQDGLPDSVGPVRDGSQLTGKVIICRRIGVELGVGEEFSISLAMKITNSDGCRVAEVIEGEETLVAEACNHPNWLVLPFRFPMVRTAA